VVIDKDVFLQNVRDLVKYLDEHLPELVEQYGENDPGVIAHKSLRDVMQALLDYAGDFVESDEFGPLSEDSRSVEIPPMISMASLIMRDQDGAVWVQRLWGSTEGRKISSMYAKSSEAYMLGAGVARSIFGDYVEDSRCKTCPHRNSCSVLAMYSFALGFVQVMSELGVDPRVFSSIYMAAVVSHLYEVSGAYVSGMLGDR